jgi:ABC-type lipoprotein release transport system permease subunit
MFDLKSIKVGWFLGYRQLKRSSWWSNTLIVLIMVLTFLNLVVISGLLVGLIQGASNAVKEHYIGDIIISKLPENSFIENTPQIINTIENTPQIKSYTARYLTSGTLESNYKERSDFEENPEKVSTVIAGIDPDNEHSVTEIKDKLVEGEFLEDDDFDKIVLGAFLLEKYLQIDSPGFLVLKDVEIGSKVRVDINGSTREMIVKGILKSKTDEIDRRAFIVDSQLRSMMGRDDKNVGEISMRIADGQDPNFVKSILVDNGIGKFAKVQTFEEGRPKFLDDITKTFNLLGTIISSIGLAVAAITVFIVIFINAITRRKYIGIMKAIGANGKTLELSYIFQSLVYAIIGSILGLILVYFILIPYVDANPINFPFSDGILVAPAFSTSIRVAILIVVTALAGYIPSRIIIRKNTLDSILGRN